MVGGVPDTNWSLGSDMQRSSRQRGCKSGGSRMRSNTVPQGKVAAATTSVGVAVRQVCLLVEGGGGAGKVVSAGEDR